MPKKQTIADNLYLEDPWRVFRIMSEFVDGFETLRDIGKAVSIFGSAQLKFDHKYCVMAERTAARFVRNGYAVITGGGNGIMEAANKGAKQAKGVSVGLNITIPLVQKVNKHVTLPLEFRYFFARKLMFAKYSKAFVVFPGGLGTMDEFFEITTLIQTGRITAIPVILVGKKYWKGLLTWIDEICLKEKTIAEKDLDIFTVTDDISEIIDIVNRFYEKNGEC